MSEIDQSRSPVGVATATPTGLHIETLSVSYGFNLVIEDVSISFPVGSVYALLGPNGSGKSTLIKVLAGTVTPRPGSTITLPDGGARSALTPAISRRGGLRFVHQDLGLVEEMTVGENVCLGNGYLTFLGRINRRKTNFIVDQMLDQIGVTMVSSDSVSELSRANKTFVAIARALLNLPPNGGCLFVDEATAALDERDSDTLLKALSEIAKSRDTAVVMVTHRLREAMSHADRIAILRDGKLIANDQKEDCTLAELMHDLGVKSQPSDTIIEPISINRSEGKQSSVLSIQRAYATRLFDVNIDVSRGEIVGVTGLEGSGKEGLVNVLSGREKLKGGTIKLLDRKASTSQLQSQLGRDFAIVPSDRMHDASFPDLTVAENLLFARMSAFRRHGTFSRRSVRSEALKLLSEYSVQPASPFRKFRTLSGGNQQKVIIARWLSAGVRLLILHEPTLGVDVGAREIIYQLLHEASERGLAVLVVTSDPTEAVELCTRVVVMVDGKAVSSLEGPALTVSNVLEATFLSKEDSKAREEVI